jgi:hypothetical protein
MVINQLFDNLPLCTTDNYYSQNIDNLTRTFLNINIDNLNDTDLFFQKKRKTYPRVMKKNQ